MSARAAAVAVAALLAAAVACRRGAPPPFTRGGAQAVAAAPADAPRPALRVLLVGDMGDDTAQQAEVARALAAAHGRAPFDLAFHLGDNVYGCGPDPTLPGAERCAFGPDGSTVAAGFAPPADASFEAKLERAVGPLARGAPPLPLHLALGNHDVATVGRCRVPGLDAVTLSRRKACLEVAHASAAWRMPGRHYVVERGPARFVVVDSNLLTGDYGGFSFDAEVEHVRAAFDGCERRPCFVVAHHPAATAAEHRDDFTPEYVARLRRLEEASGGRIAAWIAGHDHHLEHLRAPGGYDVLVSGNGSRERPRERFEQLSSPGARLLFASTARGFATLEVGAAGWSVRFESASGEPLHCCRAASPGRCEPVGCAAAGR
jgi:tartrate-resistant acid phosphatase type 5